MVLIQKSGSTLGDLPSLALIVNVETFLLTTPMNEKNNINYITLMKIFVGRNDVENEKNAIFYDETDTLMHRFGIDS